MKSYKNKIVRVTMMGLAFCCVLVLLGTQHEVKAQKRDPFRMQVVNPNKLKPKKLDAPTVVAPPDIQTRIEAYKKLKLQYLQAGLPAPKPTKALLLSELEVKGVFQTPRGYAAMVEAKPINLSYTIYPGEEFYDGQLVAIEENQLICRKLILWSDKRVEKTTAKLPLAQPNAVKDQMTTARTGGSTADESANGNKSAEAAFTQMMELLQKLLTAGQQQPQPQSPEKKP